MDPEIRLMPKRRKEDQLPRRQSKGMYLLPSLFTTANIAAGYYAILQVTHASAADPKHFDYAAIAIGIAFLFDGLDGRIARMTGTSSDFGKELDSLADVVTFGVAPAMLAWIWGFRSLAPVFSQQIMNHIVELGAIASFLFLMAGASRLARFNITSNPQPSNPGRPGKKYFVGMPIPAGAGVIAAVVHFSKGEPVTSWWTAATWLLMITAVAYLMVSTWRLRAPVVGCSLLPLFLALGSLSNGIALHVLGSVLAIEVGIAAEEQSAASPLGGGLKDSMSSQDKPVASHAGAIRAGGFYRVAIVGASSLKGKEVAEVLSDRNFPSVDIKLLDDDETIGQLESVRDEINFIQSVRAEQFDNVNFTFFAADPECTERNW